MKFKYYSILFFIVVLFTSSFVFASEEERMNIINKELDCFSTAAARPEINWNEVCVTSPASKDTLSRDEIVEKSMEDMINEHQRMANEMLNEKVIVEQGGSKVTQSEAPDGSTNTVDDIDQNFDNNVSRNADDARDHGRSLESQGRSYEWMRADPIDSSSPFANLARDPHKSQNSSEIGFEFNRSRYVEPIADVLIKGNLYGFYVGFTSRPSKDDGLFDEFIDVYKAEVRMNYGLVDYQSAPSGSSKDNHDWTIEARLLAGRDYLLDENLRVTPYFGLGFRYLDDDSAGKVTTTGAYGYDRESRYFYIPLGVELTRKIADSWLISPSVEYDWFVYGVQDSHLSDVDIAYSDLSNKQHKGMGVRGSVKFIQLRGSINFVFEPYIRYWHIEDSELRTTGIITGFEPENKTVEYGIRMGAMF